MLCNDMEGETDLFTKQVTGTFNDVIDEKSGEPDTEDHFDSGRAASTSGLFHRKNVLIGHIANSILLVTGGRKEPITEVFAGNKLETSIAVHTNHHSPSLVP